MTKAQRKELLNIVRTMPMDELVEKCKQAAEDSGLTYEEFLAVINSDTTILMEVN